MSFEESRQAENPLSRQLTHFRNFSRKPMQRLRCLSVSFLFLAILTSVLQAQEPKADGKANSAKPGAKEKLTTKEKMLAAGKVTNLAGERVSCTGWLSHGRPPMKM